MTFSRRGPARYLSHLDTARVVQRTFARAGVPIALSQGMRPKPRISLPLPLPVGAAGARELAVVEVPDEVTATVATLRALRAAGPPGVEPLDIAVVTEGHPRPQARSATYECLLDGDAGAITAAVERYEREESVIVERGSPKGRRSLDLKEFSAGVSAVPVDGGALLGFTIFHRADGAARPQEYVDLVARWARVAPVMRGLERRRIDWKGVPPAPGAGDGRSVSS